MSRLGPEARALVAAGRDALQPAAGDRERVLAALRARIDVAAGAGGGAAASAGATAASWPVIAGTIAGLAAVGAIAFVSLRSPAETPRERAATTAAAVTTSAPAVTARSTPEPSSVLDPVVAKAPEAPSPNAVAGARPSAAVRPSDRLAEEVAILSRAQTDLHAGRFASALRVLDEHQRRFPGGALAQERLAARVRALCALGRVPEAESELARLTRLSPHSLHEGRAREACAPRAKR
ncbi:MAG TPA: hypothetical protein VGK73_13300 [Polyangiaceae bacterium]